MSPSTLVPAAILSIVGGVVLAMSLLLGLNGDVQYVFGVQAVRGGGIGAAIGTFAHRPVLYRVFLGAFDDGVRLVGLRPADQLPYEAMIRLLAVALAVLAAWLLYRGLRTRFSGWTAGLTSIAAGLALAFAPNWDFLQPEWVASLLCVMAVGTALRPRSAVLAGGLSAGFIVAALGAKIATAPLALLALLLIGLVDRRRAIGAGVGAVAWSAVALIALATFPLEQRWLSDMISLNPNSPLRAGITAEQILDVLRSIGSKAILSPSVILAPAAGVLVVRSAVVGAHRALAAGGLLVAVVLAAGPMISQGEIYLYHLSAVPILAAGIVGFGIGRSMDRGESPSFMVIALTATAVACIGVTTAASRWRLANLDSVLWLVLAVSILLAAIAARPRAAQRPAAGRTVPLRRWGWHGAALLAASVAAIAPVVLPAAAWSLDPRLTARTNRSWEAQSQWSHATLTGLSETIGRDTQVLYLTYGTVPYGMENPTTCRYPSPLWLRLADLKYVRSFFSYMQNRACLDSQTPRYLIRQQAWLRFDRLEPRDQDTLRALYDCSRAIHLADILACPRRQ